MYTILPDVRLLDNQWYNLNTLTGVPVGTYFIIQNKSSKPVYIFKSVLSPAPDSIDGVLISAAFRDGLSYTVASGSSDVWVKGVGAILSIDLGNDPNPDGLYYGLRAETVQSYDEANKKNGTQFSASRLVTAPDNTTIFNSIIKLGDKPIDLKSRQFAYTGIGLDADIYESPTYTVTGTADPVFSSNGITPSSFDFQLYAGNAFTLTNNGTKFSPTIFCIGPTSQQSKGVPTGLYGSNYILASNKSYLLTFRSRDPQPQEIAVRIEGYNGLLDLPL